MRPSASIARRTTLPSSAAEAGLNAVGCASAAAPFARHSFRLRSGRERDRHTPGGVWEVWQGQAALPHRCNSIDSAEPAKPCFQRSGWYRAGLDAASRHPNGLTPLHCEGARQKSTVWAGIDGVAHRVGGYGEWTVDIAGAAARNLERAGAKGEVQLAVCCDNSRAFESVPSNRSGSNLYGGLYRGVDPASVPATTAVRVHIETTTGPGGTATAATQVRPHHPSELKDAVE
jgi:beta-galactosidase